MNAIKPLLTAALVASAMVSPVVVAATLYTVTPLGPPGKRIDIDNSTNILTMKQDSPALAHLNIVIVNWSGGGRNYYETRPGSLPGATRSWGNAFNDAGQITGYAETADAAGNIYGADGYTLLNQTRAFIYGSGVFTDLSELLPLKRGPIESNGSGSAGVAINSQGQVVGSWTDASGTHAFLYSYGTMTDLGSLGPNVRADTRPTAINSVGQITGSSATSVWNGPHAFIYRQHLMQDLGVIGANPWSAGTDINDMGQVIGKLGGAPHGNRCFIYQDGVMSDLGTLGGSQCFANKINNAGVVVGRANPGGPRQGDSLAFVYMDHKMTDLNTLVDPPNALTRDDTVLRDVIAINDNGEILAVDQSFGRFFLLVPIPAAVESPPAAPAPPPAAAVAISVVPNTIATGDSATLTWSSTNATSCTASGAWSGSESTSGSASATPTTTGSNTYTLSCTGSGGTAVASTALTVNASPTMPSVATPPAAGGGGGAFGIEWLLGLVGLSAFWRRRPLQADRA